MQVHATRKLSATLESWASLAHPVSWSLALLSALLCGVPLTASAQTSSTVQFDVGQVEVWRHDSTAYLRVGRLGVMTNAAEVDYRTEPGTAQPGVDYIPVSGRLRFDPSQGDNFWVIAKVQLLTNSPPGGDKVFRVVLSAPSAGLALGLVKEVTVRILNDGVGFALEPRFGADGVFNLPEPAGDALVDVVILGDTGTRPVSVAYRTESVSATPGGDYTSERGTLTFSAGETRKTIAIPITNDSLYESSGTYFGGVESFRLRLENPEGGLPLSRPREVEIGILDNDLGYVVGGINHNAVLLVEEKAGTVTVSVNRQGDFGVPSSVHYVVATDSKSWGQGRAVAGVDFLYTDGTLIFGPNVTNQTFTITLLDDSLIEGEKDFFIRLYEGAGGVLIATPEVRVIIQDSEQNLVRVDPDFRPDWPLNPLTTAVAPNGKVLLVTPTDRLTGEDGFLVLRLLPDGRVDPTWQAPTIRGFVNSLVVEPTGQVLFAGGAENLSEQWGNPAAPHPEFTVNGVACRHLARLREDGSLDTDLAVELPAGTSICKVARQTDGKILVALRSQQGDELFRLHSTGAVDNTFETFLLGSAGILTIYPAPGGGIYLGGYGSFIRLNSDGRPDAGFQPPEGFYDLHAMQPDGRLLVRVQGKDGSYLARLTADGRLDSTFTPRAIPSGGLIVLPAMDGKIWILQPGLSEFPRFELRRKNANGADDPTWPPASISGVIRECGPWPTLFSPPDGSLLLVRFQGGPINGQPRARLARLLVDAPLPRFELDAASVIVPENGGKVRINLVLCGVPTESTTVAWHTEGGTAQPGVDYVPADGSLTFGVNESSATLEIELIDNVFPDLDRTLCLRLQGPPPERNEYPLVELTIANDDVGFPPAGIQCFPNGRVLLRATGCTANSPYGFSVYAYLQTSGNLRDWSEPDLGGDSTILSVDHPETIDRSAPTQSARFFRLQRW
jgi:uncharacterized delta-60 repeat protein